MKSSGKTDSPRIGLKVDLFLGLLRRPILSDSPLYSARFGNSLNLGPAMHMLLSKSGERWQYAILPLEPEVAATAGAAFNMGTTGWASSGGVLFDHRSAPDGSLAYYYEIDSMDPCLGHSDDRYQARNLIQPADIGWPTGNGKKLSNSPACCLAHLCLATA